MSKILTPQVVRFDAYEETDATTGEKSIVMGAHPEGRFVTYEDYKTLLRELTRERYSNRGVKPLTEKVEEINGITEQNVEEVFEKLIS